MDIIHQMTAINNEWLSNKTFTSFPHEYSQQILMYSIINVSIHS